MLNILIKNKSSRTVYKEQFLYYRNQGDMKNIKHFIFF